MLEVISLWTWLKFEVYTTLLVWFSLIIGSHIHLLKLASVLQESKAKAAGSCKRMIYMYLPKYKTSLRNCLML